MSQQLINHNSDLKKLRDEGYQIQVSGGYLITHHIPYVNKDKEVKFGKLICHLPTINPLKVSPPPSHTVYFSGEIPCHKDGSIIVEIFNSSPNQLLFEGTVGNHLFSSKPARGNYIDYFEKVNTYSEIISSPAKAIDPNVTAKSFLPIIDEDENSVFQYYDTNSSRSNIDSLNQKFSQQKIAIVGLGGTGSYILDLISKTQVKEIHLFDKDDFLQHNAFRSPGAATTDNLFRELKKVNYFSEIYSNMHKGIIPHDFHITKENLDLLRNMTYVFICIDNNSSRKTIIGSLLQLNIPFIDVGLGVNLVDDKLIGTLRVTVGTTEMQKHIEDRVPLSDENGDNDYSTNIQIADLNAFNAILAVIKWKKLVGFYQDLENEYHSTYSINVAQLLNEEKNES